MMLEPHIFGEWPVASRIIAIKSRQSLRRFASAILPTNADGLAFLGFVLIPAITPPATTRVAGDSTRLRERVTVNATLSAPAIALITFVCTFGFSLGAAYLRHALPPPH